MDENNNLPIQIENAEIEYPLLDDYFCDDDLKQKLDDIVRSMESPQMYHMVGQIQPKTYLFYGEPGTGKTFAVKAIRNELTKRAKSKIAQMDYNIGTMGTAYINMGSVKLQTFFNTGLKLLLENRMNISHIIYFFDECDAIMGKRGNSQSHKEDDKLLETLMKNLQAINDSPENEYAFLSTNIKEGLDSASIRSGRVDYQVKFNLPTLESRKRILQGYIDIANDNADYKFIRNYDAKSLAESMEGFNCADVEEIVKKSISQKIKEELRKDKYDMATNFYITEKYLKQNIDHIKELKTTKQNNIGFIRT